MTLSTRLDGQAPLTELADLADAPRPTLAQRVGSKKVAPWIFIAPLLAFGLIFFLLPLTYAGYLSLARWNGFTHAPVGRLGQL